MAERQLLMKNNYKYDYWVHTHVQPHLRSTVCVTRSAAVTETAEIEGSGSMHNVYHRPLSLSLCRTHT